MVCEVVSIVLTIIVSASGRGHVCGSRDDESDQGVGDVQVEDSWRGRLPPDLPQGQGGRLSEGAGDASTVHRHVHRRTCVHHQQPRRDQLLKIQGLIISLMFGLLKQFFKVLLLNDFINFYVSFSESFTYHIGANIRLTLINIHLLTFKYFDI